MDTTSKKEKKASGIDSAKLKQLELAVDSLEKQFGKGAIMRLGDDSAVMKVQSISTGSMTLDFALGVGGLPRGRVTEIYGPESSGKTTLALHVIAEAQKAGGIAAIVDAEHAFDPSYARRLGVDINALLISQPESGEQALSIVETLVRSGAVDVVAVDSVAALVPQAELEGEMGDAVVGLQARLMSQALRKLTGAISKSSCSCIFINQLRDRIGGDVRQSGNDYRRQGAEVLFFGPSGYPQNRTAEGWRCHYRQPHEGEGGEEQGRASLQDC